MHLAREDRAVARLVDAAQFLHDRRRQPDLVAGDGAAAALHFDRLEFAADPIGLVEIGGHQLGGQDVDLHAARETAAKSPRPSLGMSTCSSLRSKARSLMSTYAAWSSVESGVLGRDPAQVARLGLVERPAPDASCSDCPRSRGRRPASGGDRRIRAVSRARSARGSAACPSGTGQPTICEACEARYSVLRPEPGCRRTRRCRTGGIAARSSSVNSVNPICARE